MIAYFGEKMSNGLYVIAGALLVGGLKKSSEIKPNGSFAKKSKPKKKKKKGRKKKPSKDLQKHLDMGLDLTNSFFRLGSKKYTEMFKEVKAYWSAGNPILKGPSEWMVKHLDVGTEAIYNGKKVILDIPKRGGKKKFIVYHDSGKRDKEGNIKAMKIEWGDPNLTVKNHIYSNSKSYWKRHRCDTKAKQNPKKAGFWACYGPTLFAKQLGLQSDMPW